MVNDKLSPETVEDLASVLDIKLSTIKVICSIIDGDNEDVLTKAQTRAVVFADMLITNMALEESLAIIIVTKTHKEGRLNSDKTLVMEILDNQLIILTEGREKVWILNQKGESVRYLPSGAPIMMITLVLNNLFSRMHV